MSIFIDVKVKGIVESIASVHFVEGILQFGCFKPLYVICTVFIIDLKLPLFYTKKIHLLQCY